MKAMLADMDSTLSWRPTHTTSNVSCRIQQLGSANHADGGVFSCLELSSRFWWYY